MADVFISYKSDRRPAAEHLAEVLENHGYSVWFDYSLLSGSDFSRQIETELKQAKAVVVLWCDLSVDSDWVRSEARYAKRTGKFCPVKIAPCELPIEFDGDQTQDLTKWDGAPKPFEPGALLGEVSNRVGREPKPDLAALDKSSRAWQRYGSLPLIELGTIDPIETRREGAAPDFVAASPAPHSKGFAPQKPTQGLSPLVLGGGIAAGIGVAGIAIALVMLNAGGAREAERYAIEDAALPAMAAAAEEDDAPIVAGRQRDAFEMGVSEMATDASALPPTETVASAVAAETIEERLNEVSAKPEPAPVTSAARPRQRSKREMLVGTWNCDNYGMNYDGTMTVTFDDSGSSRATGTYQGYDPYTGELSMSFRLNGTWRLTGDLLHQDVTGIDISNVLVNGMGLQAFAGTAAAAAAMEQQFEQQLLYEAQYSSEPSTIEALSETELIASTSVESSECYR